MVFNTATFIGECFKIGVPCGLFLGFSTWFLAYGISSVIDIFKHVSS